MHLEPATIDALKALVLGFAFSGLIASAYELALDRPVSFGLLRTGDLAAVASVPLLVFSAPLIIVRNTIRGRRIERRPFAAVVAASAIASLWSLLSGRLVLDAAQLLTGA